MTNYWAGIIGGIVGGCILLYFLTFLLGKFVATNEGPPRRAIQVTFLATILAIALYWLVGNQGANGALLRGFITYVPAGIIVGLIRWRMYKKLWVDE